MQVPNSGDAPWLGPILGSSVILGAREVVLAVRWCRWSKWLEALLEGVGRSNWCLALLPSTSAPLAWAGTR